jgi:hypothetical protein
VQVAAADRPQAGVHALRLSGVDVDGMGVRFGTCAGSPRIANLAAERASATVVDQQTGIY